MSVRVCVRVLDAVMLTRLLFIIDLLHAVRRIGIFPQMELDEPVSR